MDVVEWRGVTVGWMFSGVFVLVVKLGENIVGGDKRRAGLLV